MYRPCSGPAFLPPGVKGGMFSLCPKNSSLYTTHGGFGNGSQVQRFVNQSLRVPCEWMQRRMDAAGILTLRAEKAVLCPHPVFSSTSLQKMQRIYGYDSRKAESLFDQFSNGVSLTPPYAKCSLRWADHGRAEREITPRGNSKPELNAATHTYSPEPAWRGQR
jgi:hypothetical protein